MEVVDNEQVLQFELALVVVKDFTSVKMVIEVVQSKQTALSGESIEDPAPHPVAVNPILIVSAVVTTAALDVRTVPPLKTLTFES